MNHKLAGVCATLCFLKKVVDIPFTAWRMPDWRTRPAHLSGPSVCSLEVVNDNYCGYLKYPAPALTFLRVGWCVGSSGALVLKNKGVAESVKLSNLVVTKV